MGDRLQVEVELPAALHDQPFPPLVLQTLVENAIKHGVEPKAGVVHIRVRARRVADELVLDVADDGVGFGRSAATAGSGTGLANLRERLQGIYGDRAQLSVIENPVGGVTSIVALELPISASVATRVPTARAVVRTAAPCPPPSLPTTNP